MQPTEPPLSYLLDTNICIYVLGGEDRHATLRRRIERQPPGSLMISAITLVELGRGRPGAPRLSPLFDIVRAMPFDQRAAECYALLPFKRASFDRLIAAHALSLGLTLVTNNERDFDGIPGLAVENWTR